MSPCIGKEESWLEAKHFIKQVYASLRDQKLHPEQDLLTPMQNLYWRYLDKYENIPEIVKLQYVNEFSRIWMELLQKMDNNHQ